MITINSGKLSIPEKERFIGFAGDNLHSTKQFLVENIADQNCIYRLYLEFNDRTVNHFVLDSKVENGSTILTWNVLEEHIFKSGIVFAQIKSISESGKTYHTTRDCFLVAPSAEFSEEFKTNENAEFLRYEKELNEIYEKIKKTDLSSFVTSDRTIAGLTLSSNITADELCRALNIYQTKLNEGAPTFTQGPADSFLIDTLNSDLYYCDKVTLSGYNWIKLTGASGSSSTDTKSLSQAQINLNGELVLSFSDGTTENLGVVVGKDGSKGDKGADGTSVYISNIGESTADSGKNVVIFNDGKTLTIKNGSKGSKGDKGDAGAQGPQGDKGDKGDTGAQGPQGDKGNDGYTPVKGVDYFTETDKEEIVQQIITSLGTPVFGRVDDENNIILTGSLVEGEYTLKYEDDEGAVSKIGSLTIGADEPTYINYADPSSTEWQTNKRLNSSGSIVDVSVYANGGAVTNFIACKTGDVIRVKGLDISHYYTNQNGETGRATAFFFAENKSTIIAKNVPADGNGWVYENGIWIYTVGTSLTSVSGDNSSIRYCRLTGIYYENYTAEDVIITVNQEIV